MNFAQGHALNIFIWLVIIAFTVGWRLLGVSNRSVECILSAYACALF